MFTCNCEGYERDFKTLSRLKKHEQAAWHKRLTDSEFAKTEAAEKAAEAAEKAAEKADEKTEAAKNDAETARYICNCKGVEQPFKTAQSLKRNKESLSHRILTDPEFAKTEAGKKAEVKCRRFLRIVATWFRKMLLNFAGIKWRKSRDELMF